MTEFDIDGDLVRKLSALLEETGLTELEFSHGDQRIRVSRAAAAAPAVVAAVGGVVLKSEDSSATAEKNPNAVTAPMVGTVYIAPEPGTDPFVRVGDLVIEGQTLLLIEAMKTYNPIRAPRAAKVVRIMVTDATPVEYDEELIILE